MPDDLNAINRDVARIGSEIIEQRLRYLMRAHQRGEHLALLELVATAHQHGRAFPKGAQRAIGQAVTRFLTKPNVDLAVALGASVLGRGKTSPRMARAERMRDDALADAMELLLRKRDPETGEHFTIARAAELVARATPANFEWLPGVKPSTLEARTICDRMPAWRLRPRARTKQGREIYLRAVALAEKRPRAKTRS